VSHSYDFNGRYRIPTQNDAISGIIKVNSPLNRKLEQEIEISQKLAISEELRLGFKVREQKINDQKQFNDFYQFLQSKNRR